MKEEERAVDGDLEALIARCGRGEGQAWSEFVGRLQPIVLGVTRSVVGDDGMARDAAQEAWIRIWRNLSRFRSGSIHGWVRMIAVRTAFDRLRARRRQRHEPLAEGIAGEEAGEDARALQEAERRQRVREILTVLPADQREALVLRDLEGMTPAQMARDAGCSPERVRGILFRARQRFRAEWERRHGKEPS
jgi:RNA polymerase sigma-70 factor (ECF subfamily)